MPAITQATVRLTGELTAYRAVGSDGWAMGTLATERARVEIRGKLLGVRAGDTIEVVGHWADHPQHGRQLKVRECIAVQPETTEGIVAWLVSTMPSLGPKRARELVDRFGTELWTTIEHAPMNLCRVSGITPERADAIHDAYVTHRGERDDMITLRGWGLTDGQVARCVKVWPLREVVRRIHDNPYQLARHVAGFGFLRADVVASKVGVTYDAPERVMAGVAHALDASTTDGHCYLPGGDLRRAAVKLLGVDGGHVDTAITGAVDDGDVVRRGDRLYSRRMDTVEAQCTDVLRELIGG